jgi:hypothetical protein
VQRVWQKLPLDIIARPYLGHHQIVHAIVRDKGGDRFVREKTGVHCGGEKASVPYYDENATLPAGIEVVEVLTTSVTDALDHHG